MYRWQSSTAKTLSGARMATPSHFPHPTTHKSPILNKQFSVWSRMCNIANGYTWRFSPPPASMKSSLCSTKIDCGSGVIHFSLVQKAILPILCINDSISSASYLNFPNAFREHSAKFLQQIVLFSHVHFGNMLLVWAFYEHNWHLVISWAFPTLSASQQTKLLNIRWEGGEGMEIKNMECGVRSYYINGKNFFSLSLSPSMRY